MAASREECSNAALLGDPKALACCPKIAHLRFTKKESKDEERILVAKACFEFGVALMKSTSSRMTTDSMAKDGADLFIDDAMSDLKNATPLQSLFMEATQTTGMLGEGDPRACQDIFDVFDDLTETSTKAGAGACFTEFKEDHASRNSQGGDDKAAFRGNLQVKAKAKVDKS